MNILIVSDTYLPTVSGVANSTDSIARYMVSRGHTVTVVAPAPLDRSVVTEMKGLRIVSTPSIKDTFVAGKPMTPFPFSFGTIWKTVHGEKYDVIHIQEPGSIGVIALIIAKCMHIPTIGAEHTMPEQIATFFGPFYRFGLFVAQTWMRGVYPHYDAVMTPTATMASYLKKAGIRVPIYPVSNGIDIKKYVPGRTEHPGDSLFRLPPNTVRFGYLGRLDIDKHLDVAVRAMRLAAPGVHLVIAGFGKAQDGLVALARDLHVSDKVTFIGKLAEPAIINLYHELDCFVITSPVESQSIVTLQAIASGLPVIAANAGALPELVHDGENGFLVTTDDYQGFAEKMNQLAADVKLRNKFGAESRVISLAHDKPKVLHTLENIYKRLVK